MKKANLLIAGEPKSGTSALYEFLKFHPEVYMSVEKEPAYFCSDIHKESSDFYGKNIFFHHTTEESYNKLFADVRNEKIRGEASTIYLYSKTSAEEIHSYNPETKIIMMFREPVSFMHSLHSQYLSMMAEEEECFAKALVLEENRKNHSSVPSGARSPSYLFYRERANYYEHIQRFLKIFKKEQLRVIIFEEFIKDNERTFKDVLSFLEIDEKFNPEYKDVNTNKTVKFKFLYRLVQSPKLKLFFWKILTPKIYYKIKKIHEAIFFKHQKRIPLNDDLREELKIEFRPSVVKLNDLLKEEGLIEADLLELWKY